MTNRTSKVKLDSDTIEDIIGEFDQRNPFQISSLDQLKYRAKPASFVKCVYRDCRRNIRVYSSTSV